MYKRSRFPLKSKTLKTSSLIGKIALSFGAILLTSNLQAQMTLSHSFPVANMGGAKIVNLSLSGKKIAIFETTATEEKMVFYNMDYSLWKTITFPVDGGYSISGPQWDNAGNGYVFYPSETLFNNDNLLEVAAYYTNSSGDGKILIINENSIPVDSIEHVWKGEDLYFRVYNTGTGTFEAMVRTSTGVSVYSLPGSIPCDVCGNGLGVAKVSNQSGEGLSEPIPNPSSSQAKITFTLPKGAKKGQMTIYNMNGQKMKTYNVDNTFGYIMVDNSSFPAGMYYYDLTVDGERYETRKMVVVK